MDVFWTSVQSVLMIVIIIGIGYVANSAGWFNDKFSGALSKIIMRVALPMSIFNAMINNFKPASFSKLGAGVIYVFLAIMIGYVLAWLLVKVLKVPKGRRGLMITGINFANTVFIGMPLNVALFGSLSQPYVLVYYIVNTALLWTFGVWIIASDDPTGKADAKMDWSHLLPVPLWGFIIAIPFVFITPLLNFYNHLPFLSGATLGYKYDPIAHVATQVYTYGTSGVIPAVGALVTPLSLFYIGIMLSNYGLKQMRVDFHTIVVLAGRFIISPIVMVIIVLIGTKVAGIHLDHVFSSTLIIQSATPTFAVMPILATEYHGDVKFATNIVAVASVLFVVVIPVIMILESL
ncbi:AEC family transporter [Lactococcus lactis]|uniref:AEC family transporter n=1 Tax=Lactococcus lactis TaxID=1358 RepID=UPI0015D4FEBC|nr:AEC family transporter [Lactococcus lactis]MCG1001610.1 AEC family transporter [Lactococcus lactis]GFO79072.1 malate permease [Lactococcus lactis]